MTTHWSGATATDIEVRRLGPGDTAPATAVFVMMAEVFDEERSTPDEAYLDELLHRDAFWVLAATHGGDTVGGLTAHVLPLTRIAASELFVYDLAVRADHRRRGEAARLVREVRSLAAAAGVHEAFVAADDEDVDALAFYRSLGARPTAVTIFDL